jgi:hypothetical protein
VGYPEGNFRKGTISGTISGSKKSLSTNRISMHNINVLCQIYIKRQKYFCISGSNNSSLSRERIFFSLSAEAFMEFQNLAFFVLWRMSPRPYANGIDSIEFPTRDEDMLNIKRIPSGLLMEP